MYKINMIVVKNGIDIEPGKNQVNMNNNSTAFNRDNTIDYIFNG